jgi:hypothetical protein
MEDTQDTGAYTWSQTLSTLACTGADALLTLYLTREWPRRRNEVNPKGTKESGCVNRDMTESTTPITSFHFCLSFKRLGVLVLSSTYASTRMPIYIRYGLDGLCYPSALLLPRQTEIMPLIRKRPVGPTVRHSEPSL